METTIRRARTSDVRAVRKLIDGNLHRARRIPGRGQFGRTGHRCDAGGGQVAWVETGVVCLQHPEPLLPTPH